jgi:tetratricopeptide (TPR) repeat protein
MSRFSKLETGDGIAPKSDAPAIGQRRGGDRAARNAAQQTDDVVYDHAYYQAEGDRLFALGSFEQALRVYSRAIQSEAAQVNPWVGQVLCLLMMGQAKEAMVWVKRALELFPEEARVIALQGSTYAHQGMVQRGIGCSDAALAKNGSDPLVWVLRGEVLSMAENSNAQFCFEKALEMRPSSDASGRWLLSISRQPWERPRATRLPGWRWAKRGRSSGPMKRRSWRSKRRCS